MTIAGRAGSSGAMAAVTVAVMGPAQAEPPFGFGPLGEALLTLQASVGTAAEAEEHVAQGQPLVRGEVARRPERPQRRLHRRLRLGSDRLGDPGRSVQQLIRRSDLGDE